MSQAVNGIQEIRNAASNAGGWATRLEGLLGDLVDGAAKVSSSPIVQALENRVLPPGTEQAIAALITTAADEYDKVARSADSYRQAAGGPLSGMGPTSAGAPQPGSGTGSPIGDSLLAERLPGDQQG